MGSFNQTCHISNLPITCNDEVVLMIMRLSSKETLRHYTYDTTSVMYPASLPFIAKYADYGRFKDFKGNVDLGVTAETLIKMYSDTLKNPGELDFETCINYLTYNEFPEFKEGDELTNALVTYSNKLDQSIDKGIFTENLKLTYFPYVLMVVRKDVWDVFVNLGSERKRYTLVDGYYQEISAPKAFEREFENARINAKTMYDLGIELVTSADEEVVKKLHEKLLPRTTVLGNYKTGNRGLAWSDIYDQKFYKDFLNDTETGKEIKKSVIELDLVQSVMAMTRRIWNFPSGLGSQVEDWELSEKVFNKLGNIAHEISELYIAEENS